MYMPNYLLTVVSNHTEYISCECVRYVGIFLPSDMNCRHVLYLGPRCLGGLYLGTM